MASIGFVAILCMGAFIFWGNHKGAGESSSIPDQTQLDIDEGRYVVAHKMGAQELGEIQSIIEYGEKLIIAAHYPSFGEERIDRMSREFVAKRITEFKADFSANIDKNNEDKYELSIDYETHGATEDLVSVAFYVTEDSSAWAHPDVNIVTKTYDLVSDAEVALDDILRGEYLQYISQVSEQYFLSDDVYKSHIDPALFEQGIYPDARNYAIFILKRSGILFQFAKYQLFSGDFGMPSVEIAYTDLTNYLKPEFAKRVLAEEYVEEVDPDISKPKPDFTLPRRELDPNKPMVALTFDDGPNKKTTVPILDILKENGSVATFFVLGNRVASNADILKRMLEEGSEIGNHSFNHKELTKLSYEELMDQVRSTQYAVIETTGFEPKLLRPTYGSFDDALQSSVEMPLILWSVDTRDWKSRDASSVLEHVLKNVRDGDIVLMHDIYDSTAEAVRLLVPELVSKGYQLVTVSELFESKGISLNSGQVYRR